MGSVSNTSRGAPSGPSRCTNHEPTRGEDLRQQEVEQRPQLVQVVLQRGREGGMWGWGVGCVCVGVGVGGFLRGMVGSVQAEGAERWQ